jgi:23S rRNA pseudouridine2605 synthase
MTDSDSQRLAKRIARAGLCSRRDAERWIEEGRVVVNGSKVTSPALNVGPEDVVLVDGTPLPAEQAARLWKYNKPTGLVVTARDEKGRPTVFDRLPPTLPRVVSIGRLDLNSEGLLLLTNDGDLARKLELPATGWIRRYRVRVHGRVEAAKLESLAGGVTIEGIRYGEIRAELERQQGANAWVVVSLTEGKNREVRKVMEHLGYVVNRLIRVSYGPFHLGTMARGAVEEVPAKIMRDLIGGESRKNQGNWAKAKPKQKFTPRRNAKVRTDGEGETTSGPSKSGPSKSGPSKLGPSKSGFAKKGVAKKRFASSSDYKERDGAAGSAKQAAGKHPGGKRPMGKRPAGKGPSGKGPTGKGPGAKRETPNADRRR